MTPQDLLISQLTMSGFLYEQALKDFSESDSRFQPFPGGNHAIWILLHLAVTEDRFVHRLTGDDSMMATLYERYEHASTPDSNDPLTKEQAFTQYRNQQKRTLEMIRSMPAADWAKPAPEGFPPMLKTVGEVLGLIGSHPFWHFGQVTVNRRMLKKPNFL
jgi:uncharacterized damage-inducible protein DinB